MFSFLKSKKMKLSALFLGMLAASVFAGEGSLNYYGQHGVHKTQSAQTLGHGRFGLGFFIEGADLYNIIPPGSGFCQATKGIDKNGNLADGVWACNAAARDTAFGIGNYIGANGYPFLSLGLSEVFDFSIGIPIYGEYLKIDKYKVTDNLSAGGQGNLFISSKLRIPFDSKTPIDIALIAGLSISTGKGDFGKINDYGAWVRDPIFLNVVTENPITAGGENGEDGEASVYTNSNSFFKIGLATTLDFGRMKAKFPLMIHLNYAYRMMLGDGANFYPNIQSIAAALELTPVEFVSIFSEFYLDMPTQWPKNNSKTDLSTISVGTTFHLSKKADLQLGTQIFIGQEDKYLEDLEINLSDNQRAIYKARLIPKYMIFGGLTFKLFTFSEPEAYRNPDTDDDGVCDPWVRETGREREFAHICRGIDLCPYEPGEPENRGCPEEEEVAEEPTIIFTANPDLIQKGKSATLTWQVTNATEISIDGGIGAVDANGSKKVKPTENTTYTLIAKGDGGARKSTVEVEVASGPVPTMMFTATPDVIQKGQPVTLNWQVTNATEVSIEGIGKVAINGSKKVKPNESTTFIITATGEGGTVTSTADVEVAAGPVPIILFSVNPESVQAGSSATLKWQVTNATEVSIDGGIGTVQAKGSKLVKPAETTAYTLTAVGEGGTQTETVEVEVTAAPVIEAKVNLQGVTFGSGNATLTSNAKKVLDGVAEQLLANPKVKIEIHGHTDNQGNPKANQELSERRAKSVIGYLATKGVKISRMASRGFGADVPIADNKTADGREQNRRIEMIRVDN
jgi:outer membrane protein OmpA-like peptidoglycan-associated protein